MWDLSSTLVLCGRSRVFIVLLAYEASLSHAKIAQHDRSPLRFPAGGTSVICSVCCRDYSHNQSLNQNVSDHFFLTFRKQKQVVWFLNVSEC